jgi:hypothetical protein
MNENGQDAASELEAFVEKWEGDIPAEIVPVLREHYRNLLSLTKAMQAAGRSQEEIRNDVHVLVRSYEAKLIEAIRLEDMR